MSKAYKLDDLISSLKGTCIEIDSNDYRDEIDMQVDTNYVREIKKCEKPRSKDEIWKHTVAGFCAEKSLQIINGSLESYSPITKNAEGLSFLNRQTDLLYGNTQIAVKSKSKKYPMFYLSHSQISSINHLIPHNEYMIAVEYVNSDLNKSVYKYNPLFIAKTKHIVKYITPLFGRSTKWSGHHLNYQLGIEKNEFIDLR